MMKKLSKYLSLLSCFILLLLGFPQLSLRAQDSTATVYMEFTTWKYSDGTRDLMAKLTASNDNGTAPAAGVRVHFFASNDVETQEIGNIESGADGKAQMKINRTVRLPKNKDGFIHFIAKSEAKAHYAPSEGDILVKDATLSMDFTIKDSVKTVVYSGTVINGEGKEEPLASMDVYIYVPRMFSLLKIKDGYLEPDGKGEMEFPTDLIGDSTGVVKLIARVEDHPEYGNLEASANIDWALRKHRERFEGPQRELWTPIAPLWMIITLIIMLTGVWGHYMYAVFQLYKIGRAGKKAARLEKES